MDRKALVALAVLMASGSVAAQEGSDKADALFSIMDADQSGYIDPVEAARETDVNFMFNEADKNMDGRLNETEFMVALGEYLRDES